MGCHALLQWIFLTQGLNPSLLHLLQVIYHQCLLSCQKTVSWRFLLPTNDIDPHPPNFNLCFVALDRNDLWIRLCHKMGFLHPKLLCALPPVREMTAHCISSYYLVEAPELAMGKDPFLTRFQLSEDLPGFREGALLIPATL